MSTETTIMEQLCVREGTKNTDIQSDFCLLIVLGSEKILWRKRDNVATQGRRAFPIHLTRQSASARYAKTFIPTWIPKSFIAGSFRHLYAWKLNGTRVSRNVHNLAFLTITETVIRYHVWLSLEFRVYIGIIHKHSYCIIYQRYDSKRVTTVELRAGF